MTLIYLIHQGNLQICKLEHVKEIKNDAIKLEIISNWMFIEVMDID